MSRRDLHAFLLSEVPQEKMTLGTKVLSIQQNQYGVMIRTNDGKHHHADILIGSDGAYSAVRQSLFKQMSAQGILPKSDGEALKVCHMGILGTTERLDPEKFPRAHETYGHSGVVIGDKTRHTVSFVQTMSMGVGRQKGMPERKERRKGKKGQEGRERRENQTGRARFRTMPREKAKGNGKEGKNKQTQMGTSYAYRKVLSEMLNFIFLFFFDFLCPSYATTIEQQTTSGGTFLSPAAESAGESMSS